MGKTVYFSDIQLQLINDALDNFSEDCISLDLDHYPTKEIQDKTWEEWEKLLFKMHMILSDNNPLPKEQ